MAITESRTAAVGLFNWYYMSENWRHSVLNIPFYSQLTKNFYNEFMWNSVKPLFSFPILTLLSWGNESLALGNPVGFFNSCPHPQVVVFPKKIIKREKGRSILEKFSKLVVECWHSFLLTCLIYSVSYDFMLWDIVLNSVSSLDLGVKMKYAHSFSQK